MLVDDWPAALTSQGLPQLREMKQNWDPIAGPDSFLKLLKGISCVIFSDVESGGGRREEAVGWEMPLLLAANVPGLQI